jgi:hypothetical protein
VTSPTSVCVDNCQFTVDGDGRLVLNLTPSTTCAPNLLECDTTGLHVTKDAPHLHEAVALQPKTSSSAGGRVVGQISNVDSTVDIDTGTARGLWTVNANKSVTINCTGVYHLDTWGAMLKNTGTVRGQQSRLFLGTAVASTFDDRDATNTIDISTTTEGPEANAACIRTIAAGTVVSWRYLADNVPAGSSGDYNGEFSLTYLGEVAS